MLRGCIPPLERIAGTQWPRSWPSTYPRWRSAWRKAARFGSSGRRGPLGTQHRGEAPSRLLRVGGKRRCEDTGYEGKGQMTPTVLHHMIVSASSLHVDLRLSVEVSTVGRPVARHPPYSPGECFRIRVFGCPRFRGAKPSLQAPTLRRGTSVIRGRALLTRSRPRTVPPGTPRRASPCRSAAWCTDRPVPHGSSGERAGGPAPVQRRCRGLAVAPADAGSVAWGRGRGCLLHAVSRGQAPGSVCRTGRRLPRGPLCRAGRPQHANPRQGPGVMSYHPCKNRSWDERSFSGRVSVR